MAKKKTNNRRAFGLCKKYGIELPKGATPPEAWDAFNEFRRSGLIQKDDDNEALEIKKGGLLDGAGSEDDYKPFINVYLFGDVNKGLKSQGINQLRKSLKSYNGLIDEHKKKIKNPKISFPQWDEFDDKRKAREIKHWEKELYEFSESVKQIEKLLAKKE